MPSLYLIDAHAYLHRAFHALPPMSNPKGEPTQAVYGFMRMILKIIKTYKPDCIAVCFDRPEKTFRHEQFPDYKATRKEIDPTLISQFPKARRAVEAMGLSLFDKPGYEADDLIAHLAHAGEKRGLNVVIVSGDKDVLQLVNDHITVLNEPKDILYDTPKVIERYGVTPEQIPDIFALMGDTSDNVPGVKGIGEKTATKLIQQFGGLEALLAAAKEVPGKTGQLLQKQAEQARLSRRLVDLHRNDLDVTVDWPRCEIPNLHTPALETFLKEQGFLSLLRDIAGQSASASTPPRSSAPAAPAKPLDLSKRDYQTLRHRKDLEKWLEAVPTNAYVVMDTETDALDALHSRLVGISLAYQTEHAAYIPLGHQVLGAGDQMSLEEAAETLNAFFKKKKPRITGHNLKYDWMCLIRHGITPPGMAFDTMVAAYVINPSRNSYGLKELALEVLGELMTSIDVLIGKGAKQKSMSEVPVEDAAPYACADADMTLRLLEKFEPELRTGKLWSLFADVEMPLIPVLADMETLGVLVDQKRLQTLGEDLAIRMKKLEATIHQLAGETFNLNSPKQLAVILFEKLKLPAGRKTKTGYSTDEEVLQGLADQHELPSQLLEFRELQKLQSTYVQGLRDSIDPVDGRVHTHFNQTVASTGRLSSTNPNLQNIPIRTETGRLIRQAFVPAKGYTLMSADYSQIDLRMLAHISQDPVMQQAFRDGEDIHTTTACEIFGVKPSAVTADLRRISKSINFGIVYGISAFGLSQQLGIPMNEAKAHIDRYFERYAGVRAWMDQCLKDARESGHVRTLLGRIRYVPDIQAKNPNIRGFGERMALNTPIQGTSADVIKVAMVQLAQQHREKKLDWRMLLQVHDELVFEVPDGQIAQAVKQIKPLMEDAVKLSIPVIVDFKAGPSWAEMKPISR